MWWGWFVNVKITSRMESLCNTPSWLNIHHLQIILHKHSKVVTSVFFVKILARFCLPSIFLMKILLNSLSPFICCTDHQCFAVMCLVCSKRHFVLASCSIAALSLKICDFAVTFILVPQDSSKVLLTNINCSQSGTKRCKACNNTTASALVEKRQISCCSMLFQAMRQ